MKMRNVLQKGLLNESQNPSGELLIRLWQYDLSRIKLVRQFPPPFHRTLIHQPLRSMTYASLWR